MRLLLIEDEAEYLADFITEIEKQYVVDVAYNGVEGTYLSEVNDYDAIVLDCSLPDSDSVDVCKSARSINDKVPILAVVDKVNHCRCTDFLEAGADVYLTKPLLPKEFIAQVWALVRRNSGKNLYPTVVVKNLAVNLTDRTVTIDDICVLLRRKEYDILEYLLINRGKVVTKEKLLEHVWDAGLDIESNTLEVQMKNLRDKIERPFGVTIIRTVRGFGYVIDG